MRSIFLRKFSDLVKFGRTPNFLCRDFTCRIPSHINENGWIHIFKNYINMNYYVGHRASSCAFRSEDQVIRDKKRLFRQIFSIFFFFFSISIKYQNDNFSSKEKIKTWAGRGSTSIIHGFNHEISTNQIFPRNLREIRTNFREYLRYKLCKLSSCLHEIIGRFGHDTANYHNSTQELWDLKDQPHKLTGATEVLRLLYFLTKKYFLFPTWN